MIRAEFACMYNSTSTEDNVPNISMVRLLTSSDTEALQVTAHGGPVTFTLLNEDSYDG